MSGLGSLMDHGWWYRVTWVVLDLMSLIWQMDSIQAYVFIINQVKNVIEKLYWIGLGWISRLSQERSPLISSPNQRAVLGLEQ